MSPETGDGDQLLEPGEPPQPKGKDCFEPLLMAIFTLALLEVVEMHRQSLRQSSSGQKSGEWTTAAE